MLGGGKRQGDYSSFEGKKKKRQENILSQQEGIGVILLLEIYYLSFNFSLSTFSKNKQKQLAKSKRPTGFFL